ncbi:hypothetical protein [Streptomyces sp. NPDC098781]|uniref:hypothetical protein n=1 Tax=Streptomyces sp. NPDC098781 TaxID=3366097 RepID=UPI003827F9FC
MAALTGLPGSAKGATAVRPYTCAGNPWRGASQPPGSRRTEAAAARDCRAAAHRTRA